MKRGPKYPRNRATRTQRIATAICDRLFTNGAGEKADRLVLELPGKRDGGGWSRGPAWDQIVTILVAEGL